MRRPTCHLIARHTSESGAGTSLAHQSFPRQVLATAFLPGSAAGAGFSETIRRPLRASQHYAIGSRGGSKRVPGFSEIEQEFDETLGFIQNDLAAICAKDLGTNYTAALLIGCACDVIAQRRGGRVRDFEVFAELLPDTSDWRTLAKPLFEAVRHGLAHGFDTKEIRFNGGIMTVTISWRRREHLSIDRTREKPSLVLNVQSLATALNEKIDSLREQLIDDSSACDRFRMSCRPGSKSKQVLSIDPREVEAWSRLTGMHF